MVKSLNLSLAKKFPFYSINLANCTLVDFKTFNDSSYIFLCKMWSPLGIEVYEDACIFDKL